MIDIKSKIHDKFSIEFKVGFIGKRKVKDNNFAINTWLFIPNSLDLNPTTYGKEQFYRDVKSNVRLITPIFTLRDIVGGEAEPLKNIRNAFEKVALSPTGNNITDYEYHIKMFAAIFKSSMRDSAEYICSSDSISDLIDLCNDYIKSVREIRFSYRELKKIINVDTNTPQLRDYFQFGDEYISHLIELYSFRIVSKIDENIYTGSLKDIRKSVIDLIKEENDYQSNMNFYRINQENDEENRSFVFRFSVLKKYIESALYIKLYKKQDGKAIKEIYYSFAAGIAMIFATIIAFTFQRKFGNFSIPLFVALVVSYMLKDRIKELMRYYFVHKPGRRYFDNKAIINIKNQEIGWIREGVDFISDDRIPTDVMELRNRSALIEAENRVFDEKILLYRKLVYINNKKLQDSEYHISGVHDIFRLHVNRFIQKMDDPRIALRSIGKDDKINIHHTDKIYYLHIVMQFTYMDQSEYRHFRITLSRDGIRKIEESASN